MSQAAATKNTFSYAAPVAQKERIVILDSLRGFAILGILLMNIGSFGLPGYLISFLQQKRITRLKGACPTKIRWLKV
ncbi:MAG: hypothetical protein ACR2KX_12050 [Chitinophagaceae bacterium]